MPATERVSNFVDMILRREARVAAGGFVLPQEHAAYNLSKGGNLTETIPSVVKTFEWREESEANGDYSDFTTID